MKTSVKTNINYGFAGWLISTIGMMSLLIMPLTTIYFEANVLQYFQLISSFLIFFLGIVLIFINMIQVDCQLACINTKLCAMIKGMEEKEKEFDRLHSQISFLNLIFLAE